MMENSETAARYLVLELPEQQPAVEAAEFEAGGLTGDRPAMEDLLGVQHYADALAKFVLHPETQPLVIGIHGPWGKGKSTFMNFVEAALINKRSAADAEIVTVDFNAWRYQDSQQIWAGLACKITERLEARLSWWNQIGLWRQNAWARRRGELLSYGFALAVGIAVAILVAIQPPDGNQIQSLQDFYRLLGTDKYLKLGLGGGAAVLLLLWRIPQLLQPTSQRILEYGRLPDYRTQMGYQHRVLDDVRRVYGVLKRKREREVGLPVRVVVFIDDLDRCSEEKIVEILQAINLILGASEFFVFLGVASEMLHRAIRNHYKRDDEEVEEDFPLRYLEKIIQVSFRLPQLPPERQDPLIEKLFSETTQNAYRARGEDGRDGDDDDEPDPEPERENQGFRVDLESLGYLDEEIGATVSVTVQDTEHELRSFLELHRFLGDNPRVKKHVINIHRLVKILLQEPGITWPIERQRQLVVWLIFCHCWPRNAQQILDLSDELKDSPDVLKAWRELSGTDDAAIDDFIGTAKQDLPGQCFVAGGVLRQAMELSRMATTFKVDDDPVEAKGEDTATANESAEPDTSDNDPPG